jgi:crotonobetainyl-CoA:carnitine CoA-transferase CaiB-like acyl-CoA transferase
MTRRFSELVVVELAGSVAGNFAGKLFSDYGATVLKVEPPGGDPQRAVGERWQGTGTLFAYLNTGKKSVALDLVTATGRGLLGRLLGRADLVIESSSPEPLVPVTAEVEDERLVRLYISPFGLTGPFAGYRSTPFTDYAIAGQMFLSGEPDREPIQGAGRQTEYQAGAYGFIGAMAALWERERGGRGQTVDVSHMEGMASLHQWTTVRYTHGGYIQQRVGNRYDTTHPITIYPCKDGYVGVSAPRDDQLERFLAGAGLSHLLEDPRFANGVARLQHADAFDEQLLPWLMQHTVEEIVTLGQELRVPVGPVPGMLELLEDRHLAARGFWRPLGDGTPLRYPGPPFRMSGHERALHPPPVTGDHTRWYLNEMGVEQIDALRQAGIVGEADAYE